MVTTLYEQQASLLRSAGMKHKLAATLYTHSTLMYIRCLDRLAHGTALCTSFSSTRMRADG